MGYKKTQEDFIADIINTYDIKREDFEISEYLGWDKPITFQCNRCGISKTVVANSLLKKKGNKKHICRCYGYSEEWHEINKKFNNWINEQKEYDLLENYNGNRVNILCRCRNCNAKRRRSINSLLQNQPCQVCKSKQGIKKTNEQFLEELGDIYSNEYIPLEEYKGSDVKILMKHILCGKIFYTKPHNILTGKGGKCPICSVKSKGELKIQSFLELYNIEFEKQKRVDGIKQMPFDFFLPSYNLLIEYQGIQHFQPVARFGGKKSFEQQLKNDEIKKNTAINLGYNYYTINYDQYNEIDTLLAQRLSCGEE